MPVSSASPDPADAPEQPPPSAESAADVVVGVDGSECALQAVRWAAQEARLREAPLRIVHAAPYLGRPAPDRAQSPELPHARRITAKAFTVARQAAPETPAITEVMAEDPVTALLRAGAEAQLMVVGISTTGAVDEMVLAPVAQRVAARAGRPLVVIPRHKGPAATGRPIVALLGLGTAEDDDVVAAFAAAMARRTGRQVSVIHTRAGAEDKRAERFPGLDVDREELPHATGVKLLGEACPTPLLVLSAGHGGRLQRGLGGVHRWLLRHCTSPMALIPPADRLAAQDSRTREVVLQR